jgi:hypothetical protein
MAYCTTLNKIREHRPCVDQWEKLLRALNKVVPDDAPLSLMTILDSNGLDYALWCLRTIQGIDRDARLFVVWCARQVQHLMQDKRSIEALNVAERLAYGKATENDLAAARKEAWDAAWASSEGVAKKRSENMEKGPVMDPSRDAAWTAAWAAAADPAMDSARNVARDAVRAAAWDVAKDIAMGTSRTEARYAARAVQEAEFRRRFGECK